MTGVLEKTLFIPLCAAHCFSKTRYFSFSSNNNPIIVG
jgi:hypothetical protein